MFFFGGLREVTPQLSNKKSGHRLQAAILRTADKILPRSKEFRRGEVYPNSFRLAGPSELVDTTGEGCSELNKLMEQGYGVILIHNHLSMRDSFEPPRHLFTKVPMMRKAPIIYAISQHNVDDRSQAFTQLFDTHLGVVITRNSAEKDESLRELEGYGKISFARRALQTLRPQDPTIPPGLVVIASTPWRQDFLGEPVLRTIEEFAKIVLREQARQRSRKQLEELLAQGMLSSEQQMKLHTLQRQQLFPDKVALVFFGIGIKGVKVYQQHVTGGWNPGETYINKMSKVYKIEDFVEEAKVAGKTEDDYSFDILRQLTPPEFSDPDSRDEARQNLAAERNEAITIFDHLVKFLKFPGKLTPRFSF